MVGLFLFLEGGVRLFVVGLLLDLLLLVGQLQFPQLQGHEAEEEGHQEAKHGACLWFVWCAVGVRGGSDELRLESRSSS